MAPEIFDPVRFLLPRVQHTPASDMYSFGQVTWQIYTGKIPFPDLTNYQAMFAILDGKSQQRSLSGREIPDALWEIMLACWRLEPPRRADALTVLRQLEAVNLAGQLGQQSPSRSDANISADAQTSSELTPTPSDVIVPNKALPPPSNNPTTYIASSPPPSSISTLDTSQKLDAVVKAASNITLEDGSLSVKAAIARSTEVWLQDLHTLFQRAKDYYPDVLWRVDGGEELGRGSKTEIWGHYAVVYSRASPALREKYFPTGSFLSSSASPAQIGFTGARASFSDDFELFYTGRSSGGLSHYEDHESMDIEEDSKNELRKDLLSMWRTRLNSDVRITTTITDDAVTSEQESKVAVIHSHRFVLASRSPYFYEQLRQTEQMDLHWRVRFESDQLELEQWDLAAAFSIMRCAMYLRLDALYDVIQARIVEEMMHGLFHAFLPFDEHEKITGGVWGAGGCKCPQCAWRAPRVLEFARKDDVKSVYLDRGARRALTAHFGEGWCTPAFAHLSSKTRRTILKGLAKRMIPSNVFPLLYASQAGMKKLEGVKEPWATVSREMLLAASDAIDKVLCGQSAECFRQREWLEIMEPEDDNVERDEKLEWIVNAIQRGMNDSNAAMLYQIFKQSMLRYPDAGPYVRMRVEETYEEMLLWLQNRWTFVKQEGGFNGLEGWILADILRGIEIDDEELLHVLKQPFAALNNKG
ncbi:uncharacterized protein PHACADRAFT_201983 [Phanerochaete carnosa HHB-10118-sp]|uniref:Protein kinase domain-containing protein n=1 Tax=Phanerochaete carnosa (strain HHB-10118-sp) TaxID=650164 RepID=K5VQV8_PHACS|nr:uncharacterized protein PHACADRAFT_201983 [Phanerochaete carnosa HHB-10118-sp]EKM49130.1 hypothetical protein PHACADRAFT_201983 [Phanerochaete carnosa HHB-10118-sp]